METLTGKVQDLMHSAKIPATELEAQLRHIADSNLSGATGPAKSFNYRRLFFSSLAVSAASYLVYSYVKRNR